MGMVASFAALLLWVSVRRVAAKKSALSVASEAVMDDRTRKHILRLIRVNEVWIGMLAIGLPCGIADGVAHRAWLPTAVGVALNLL